MSANSRKLHARVHAPQTPVGFETFCTERSRTARVHLQKIASVIGQIAPTPGRVVYLHTTNLGMRWSELPPVLFSAIDAATHMQVAQVNFALTSAAALSFVEFLVRSFPFPIMHIKTGKETPFYNPYDHRPHRDFPTLIEEQGVTHSFVENPSTDVLFSVTSQLVFGKSSKGLAGCDSSYNLQNALNQFLFFHNNFRLVPWLERKTPVQKLRTFKGFRGIHSFTLLDEPERRHAAGVMRSLEAKALRDFSALRIQSDHIRIVTNGESHETGSRHRR